MDESRPYRLVTVDVEQWKKCLLELRPDGGSNCILSARQISAVTSALSASIVSELPAQRPAGQ
jgi:hypothetical protein